MTANGDGSLGAFLINSYYGDSENRNLFVIFAKAKEGNGQGGQEEEAANMVANFVGCGPRKPSSKY